MGTNITFSGGGAAAATVQTLAATGSVTAWNSIVTGTSAGATTVTLPDALASTIGTSITVRNTGTGVITVAPFAGDTLSGQTAIGAGGAVTYTVTADGTVVTSQDVAPATTSTPVVSVVGYFDTGDIGGGTTGAMPVGGQVISAVKVANNGGNTFTVTIPNMGNTTYPLWIYTEGLGAFPWDSSSTSLIVGHAKTASTFNLYMKADDEVFLAGAQNIRVWVYAMSSLPTSTAMVGSDLVPVVDLHWARYWLATVAAPATSFVTAPGTSLINLLTSSETFGLTTSGANITVAQSGRYRFDWLLLAPNTELNDDGAVHVVVNGVSVKEVFYDMNQTSAVNQTTGTLTVDLVAGDLVSVRYAGNPTADTIIWGRGSYVQVQQVATSSIGVSSTTPVITDVTLATGTDANVASAAAVKAYVDENTKVPNVVTFTAAGTYVPSAGVKWVEVEAVGGGGGGGGAAATAAGEVAVGGSGGAGGYVRAILTAAQIGASRAVSIGAGGLAGAAAGAGGTGGVTGLGALLTCNGGLGGTAGAQRAGVAATAGSIGGTAVVTTGTTLVARQGDSADVSIGIVSGANISLTTANGASSVFGRGGRGVSLGTTTAVVATAVTGNTPVGNGAGASGSVSAGTAGATRVGAAGSSGIMRITEFF